MGSGDRLGFIHVEDDLKDGSIHIEDDLKKGRSGTVTLRSLDNLSPTTARRRRPRGQDSSLQT